jgi:predicted transcriptional regulator
MSALILSIRPKYVERIFSGRKTVELRKRSAQMAPGAHVLVYSTAPCCAVVGEAIISFREQLPLPQLWKRHGVQAAVDRVEFDDYYAGCREGVAFGLANVRCYRVPVSLGLLRDAADGFRPPQSYMRVPALVEELVMKLVPNSLLACSST